MEAEGAATDIIRRYEVEKAETMFYMGLFYEHGFGVEKSPKRAFNYFLQSS
jgi:TPR repeat protein